MSPSINSGDTVIISPNAEVTNNSIAAVAINDDDRTLKKVIFLNNDKVLLQPENDECEPILCNLNTVRIIGRVIERRERL